MFSSNKFHLTKFRRGALAGAAGVIVAVGAGVGVAHAVSGPAATPVAPATASVDRPEPGDTPDAPGEAADRPDVPGQPDLPEAGDTPDAPGQADLPEPGDTPDQAH